MVSVLTFHSDDPSSNPGEAYIFSLKMFCLKILKNNQKESGVGPF